MIYANVKELFDSIDETRGKLFALINTLNDEKAAMREPDGWAVTGIIEHLTIVEYGMMRISERLLGQAEQEGVPSDGTFHPPFSMVEKVKPLMDIKAEAPERVAPTGSQTLEQSMEKFKETRAALHNLRPRIQAVDATKPTFPHPFLGEMNLYEWVAMIGLHEQRHMAQIERILGQAGSAAA